jgi:two-component system response regulator
MRQKSVLLVEDNPDDVELALIAFQNIGFPYKIVTAQDGVQALDFLFGTGLHAGRSKEEAPLLMVLDLKLPRVNGFEVLRRVREDPALKHLPVAVLTSSGEERDRAEALKLGADRFFQKAADFHEFVTVTRAIAGMIPAD